MVHVLRAWELMISLTYMSKNLFYLSKLLCPNKKYFSHDKMLPMNFFDLNPSGGTRHSSHAMKFVCLFVLMLNVPVNNVSVMVGQSHCFLGITSTFRGVNGGGRTLPLGHHTSHAMNYKKLCCKGQSQSKAQLEGGF